MNQLAHVRAQVAGSGTVCRPMARVTDPRRWNRVEERAGGRGRRPEPAAHVDDEVDAPKRVVEADVLGGPRFEITRLGRLIPRVGLRFEKDGALVGQASLPVGTATDRKVVGAVPAVAVRLNTAAAASRRSGWRPGTGRGHQSVAATGPRRSGLTGRGRADRGVAVDPRANRRSATAGCCGTRLAAAIPCPEPRSTPGRRRSHRRLPAALYNVICHRGAQLDDRKVRFTASG